MTHLLWGDIFVEVVWRLCAKLHMVLLKDGARANTVTVLDATVPGSLIPPATVKVVSIYVKPLTVAEHTW